MPLPEPKIRKGGGEKVSKTDRGKLPDRTQIEATFSSHNLEDWSSQAFTNIWPKNVGDGKWQKKLFTILSMVAWQKKMPSKYI